MKQFSEAIKVKDGIVYHLDYHQQRVDRTAGHFFGKTVDLSLVPSQLPDTHKKGLYKCRVVYSDRIESIEFQPYAFRSIRSIGLVVDNEIDYAYKYADRSRLNQLLADSGHDEIVIIRKGFVADASSSNLVFVSNEGLFTPTTYLLPGTKRQYLLDKGIIREAEIKVDDIRRYQQVLLINAMIDPEDGIGFEVKVLSL